MTHAPGRIRRILFAAAVTLALGFGATQAVAISALDAPAARTCNPICAGECQGFGGTPTWSSCICCG